MKTQTIEMNAQAVSHQPTTYSRNVKQTMRPQRTKYAFVLALAVILATASYAGAQELSPLNIGDEKHGAHVLPPPGKALQGQSQPAGQLIFKGGPVMGAVETYAIFWVPPTLQDGTPTSMSARYRSVLSNMLRSYPGHGIDNNNTQYSSNCGDLTYVGGPEEDYYCDPFWRKYTYYVPNSGGWKGSYVDTTPYPASGCNDPYTPGNCITDAQIQTEIESVMQQKGWTGGLDKVFMLFTPQGEGSCFDSGPVYCAYDYYCAYHADINHAGTAIVYANNPYGDPAYCQTPGTPSPNNDAAADTAATAASHELSEAITDPLPLALPAWQTPPPYNQEIGDLCAYQYGTNTWDLQGSTYEANQMWNGSYFELQTEYDNHTASCVQVGP